VGPDQIVARLKAIRDTRMRVLALIDALGNGDAGTWVEVIAAIVTRSQLRGDDDTQLALEAIRQAAADPTLSYAVRQQLYHAAVERRMTTVARLFLLASPSTIAEPVLARRISAIASTTTRVPKTALAATSRIVTVEPR